jgi:arylsulfatase A-like enzyme
MTTHVGLRPSAEAQEVAGVRLNVPEKGITYWGSAPAADRMKSHAAHDEMFEGAYAASVYDADRYFQQILDALDATGLAEDTVVIFASDHGELLGEHDQVGHGVFVWEPLTAVPLMMRMPGTGSGPIHDRVSQMIDVAPTVLDYLGLADRVPAEWQGSSLLQPDPQPGGASERTNLTAFTTDGHWKTIETRDNGVIRQGYDLTNDPGELNPIQGELGAELQAVVDWSSDWHQAVPTGVNEGEQLEVSDEAEQQELEMLRELGYID